MNQGEPQQDPRWGASHREQKARMILQVLFHYLELPPSSASCIDIGCGSGGIAYNLAPYFRKVIGVDPESWARWRDFQQQRQNLIFLRQSVENLSLPDGCADTVVCNQVYEHVADPKLLLEQIRRILRPGGLCYLAGPNLLFPIEMHSKWPLVHWLPRSLGRRLLRQAGSGSPLDARALDYWRLRRLFSSFEVIDVVPFIIKHPARFGHRRFTWRLASGIPTLLLRLAAPWYPSFIFLLRKPVSG